MTPIPGDEQAFAAGDEQPVGSAVFFFRDGRIASELRDAEFQSLLGGVASHAELAGGARDGVFCEVGGNLAVRALVFFRIAFDAAGRPDGEFSLPLTDLARRGGQGPDLGFGRIRLACRAQCPIPWLSNQLWQPRSLASDGECGIVQRAVQKNRLGFRSSVLRNGDGRSRRDLGATLDGRGGADARAGFDGRRTLDGRVVDARGAGDARNPSDVRALMDGKSGEVDGRLVVPQLVRQYQARIDSLESERVKAREQLLASRGEISRLAEELNQERERSRRFERLLRGSDFD